MRGEKETTGVDCFRQPVRARFLRGTPLTDSVLQMGDSPAAMLLAKNAKMSWHRVGRPRSFYNGSHMSTWTPDEPRILCLHASGVP